MSEQTTQPERETVVGGLTRRWLLRTGVTSAAALTVAGAAARPAAADHASGKGNLDQRRMATVIEHMETENHGEFDKTLDTFEHPRYEIIPTGDVYDGAAEVSGYYQESRHAFPDMRNEYVDSYIAEDSVVVEFDLLGTMQGDLRGFPPTGRGFQVRMTALFMFEEGSDHIVCERVYFDLYTFLQQLGLLEAAVLTRQEYPKAEG